MDSQLEFESELGELQQEFDELLELVEEHTRVYNSIPSTAAIIATMQKTKDNYTRMCMLSLGYGRILNCAEEITGDTLSLLKEYNDVGEGC